MKQFYKKAVIGMLLVSMLGLIGCGDSKDEKAVKKIEEALQAKYGEAFEVEGLGGGFGTMNSNTLKAVVHPAGDPSLKVSVEITKDLKQVYDKYVNEKLARAAREPIGELAKGIWGDSRIEVANDTGLTYPEEADTSMSYADFIKRYPNNWQIVSVYLDGSAYIDGKGDLNAEEEIARYGQFAEELKEKGYFRSSVYISYLTPEAYAKFDELAKETKAVGLLLSDEQENDGTLNVLTISGFKIYEDGRVDATKAQFQADFDRWQGERQQGAQRTGASE
ncbi:hypothetical protein ACFFSY_00580 [Paenibacillus aurantiacus]|uniref:Uncharacterized protein n=1 Tax=Paenibacillus aurantiacus TaxID=1936118 RepID=A0ABV5KHS5_9BACL